MIVSYQAVQVVMPWTRVHVLRVFDLMFHAVARGFCPHHIDVFTVMARSWDLLGPLIMLIRELLANRKPAVLFSFNVVAARCRSRHLVTRVPQC